MLLGMRRLAALALIGLPAGVLAASTTAPAVPCGCAQFAQHAISAPVGVAPGVLSAQARALRDFVLFSHRRIGADLIRQHGPYLHSLSAAFPHCADEAIKRRWLRELLASTSDTLVFAERLAKQYDSGGACGVPIQ